MDPAYFQNREDRLWWTDFFRKQIDLLRLSCAQWITEHIQDGKIYNAHPHKWQDNGHDVECKFVIDTDRYGPTGVNFHWNMKGFVSPDNLTARFTITTGVHIDGKDQQKFRTETDDPFAFWSPEILFQWVTQPYAGLTDGPPSASDNKSLNDATVQELLDTLKSKLGSWREFDSRRT